VSHRTLSIFRSDKWLLPELTLQQSDTHHHQKQFSKLEVNVHLTGQVKITTVTSRSVSSLPIARKRSFFFSKKRKLIQHLKNFNPSQAEYCSTCERSEDREGNGGTVSNQAHKTERCNRDDAALEKPE